MDDVLPAAAWSAMKSSPVRRWPVKLLADFGRVVIRLLQDMPKPANMVLSDNVEDVWLASPSVELLIGYQIDTEGLRLNVMDTEGRGL